MDAKSLLEQLLRSGQDLAQQGKGVAEAKLGLPAAGAEREAILTGAGKGAIAAGALALLLGTKSGRKLGGAALKLGSLAAIGGVAYNAYRQWQVQQSATAQTVTPINQLPAPQQNQRSEALLRVMIAAATADGHVDEVERVNILNEIRRLNLQADASALLLAQLGQAADPQALAALATDAEMAAEMYLAARVVIRVDHDEERRFLQALATALALEPSLVDELERSLV